MASDSTSCGTVASSIPTQAFWPGMSAFCKRKAVNPLSLPGRTRSPFRGKSMVWARRVHHGACVLSYTQHERNLFIIDLNSTFAQEPATGASCPDSKVVLLLDLGRAPRVRGGKFESHCASHSMIESLLNYTVISITYSLCILSHIIYLICI